MTDPSRDDDLSVAPFRALVDHFPNGVVALFDSDLTHRIVGPASLPVTGRDSDALLEKGIEEVFPADDLEGIEPELRATIDGEARSYDLEIDEDVFHVETAPVDIDGEPHGVLVGQNVTEERRMARELERQNERLEQFASMVSHDLRNPLSIATGGLELYRETGDESELDHVEAALDRIDRLTGDLLALTGAGTTGLEFEPTSLARAAEDVWSRLDPGPAALETTDTTIRSDPAQFDRLLENLLSNAIDHGGRAVTVKVGPLEDGFYVEDTGEGIPSEDREQVFEYGYTTTESGSGVGLSIVDQIADDHGWTLDLGRGSAGGARFEFHGVDRID